METNHGNIEHERNLNQGKRPNQMNYASKVFFWANLIFFILLVLWAFFGEKE